MITDPQVGDRVRVLTLYREWGMKGNQLILDFVTTRCDTATIVDVYQCEFGCQITIEPDPPNFGRISLSSRSLERIPPGQVEVE